MKAFVPPANAAISSRELHCASAPPKKQIEDTSRVKTAEVPKANDAIVVVVDARSLIRDCLVRNLKSSVEMNIVGVASLDECLWLASASNVGLVLLSCPGALDSKPNQDLLERAFDALPQTPILILSDTLKVTGADPGEEAHPSGYISTSMPLDVAIAAIRVVQSGRTPPKATPPPPEPEQPAATETTANQERLREFFTARQIAVIDALRKGKANKIIAFELNMKESTVKVHVRNIMKRLKAHNRTEVSYLANQLANGRIPESLKSPGAMRRDCERDRGYALDGGSQ